MKTILSLTFLLLTTIYSHAVVRIVDNNGNRPGGSNIYSTFVLAHTAATNGDTLLIIPSTASYGNVSISKEITVLGVGFNPDKDAGAKSTFGNITILNGASNINISGVVVTAIVIGQNNSAYTISNLIFEKSRIGTISTVVSSAPTLSNIIIRQNLFEPTTNQSAINFFVSNQSGIFISNNIFSSSTTSTVYGIYTTTGGLIVDQNLFIGTASSNHYAFRQIENCLISNNIIYGRRAAPLTVASSATYNNNISFGGFDSSFPTGGGYILNNNQVIDPDFTDANIGLYSFTMDLTLDTGSPALTASESNGEVGIYGGSTPYKNSGVSVPVVKSLTLPTAIKQGTNTSATISVNGN